jgi:hypothetical protein
MKPTEMTTAEAFEELKKIVGPKITVTLNEQHRQGVMGEEHNWWVSFFPTGRSPCEGKQAKTLEEAIAFIRDYKPPGPTPAERFAALSPEQQETFLSMIKHMEPHVMNVAPVSPAMLGTSTKMYAPFAGDPTCEFCDQRATSRLRVVDKFGNVTNYHACGKHSEQLKEPAPDAKLGDYGKIENQAEARLDAKLGSEKVQDGLAKDIFTSGPATVDTGSTEPFTGDRDISAMSPSIPPQERKTDPDGVIEVDGIPVFDPERFDTSAD